MSAAPSDLTAPVSAAPAASAPTAPSAGLEKLAVLPDWLAAWSRAEMVCSALAEALPEVAAGELSIRDCDPAHFALKGDSWKARYRVTVADRQGEQSEVCLTGRLHRPGTILAQEGPAVAFGAPEWRCVLPALGLELSTEPADAALPALSLLSDPGSARALLESGVRDRGGVWSDFRIAACRPRVMRYKYGSRCTFRFELDYDEAAAGRPWPPRIVAKTHRGGKGQNAYDAMQALWESELARSSLVTLAEPLAYLPDLKVLVQSPIAETQTLQELIALSLLRATPESFDELDGYMAKTAQALAGLHGCGVGHGKTVTLEDELSEIEELQQRLAGPIPEVAEAVTPLLAQVNELAVQYPADPAGPVHHSFRPAQVLLHDGDIGFIDFDGFCQAEPALDVALFRSKIKDVGTYALSSAGLTDVGGTAQSGGSSRIIDQICERFTLNYEAARPISRERVMLWETLDLVTSVLHAWTKVRAPRLAPRMLTLQRHLIASGLA